MSTVVVEILRGPLTGNAGVVEQGLRAIGNMADRNDMRDLLGTTTNACDGK